MTSIRIKSASFSGLINQVVSIEANFVRGFNGLTLVGSSSEVCRGGLLRAQSALENLGTKIPQRKILISLFPADQKKEGNQFDLAFAVSIFSLLQGKEKIKDDLEHWLFAGELGLDGTIQGVKGIVSFTLAALEKKLKGIIVSTENLKELEDLSSLGQLQELGFTIMACTHLKELLPWLLKKTVHDPDQFILSCQKKKEAQDPSSILPNFNDMLMSEELKEIASVVACGQHNLFITGSPGVGKSMFSERLPSIMPKISDQEKIEAFRIHSCLNNQIDKRILGAVAPFRSPHHSASPNAILGAELYPGEISLAHGGILFLDEFPEFRKDIIEALREPLETGEIKISRVKSKVHWPSKFLLVIAANNCPCGWLGSEDRRCICTTQKIMNYKRKLSGPILDRIDIHIHMDQLVVKKDKFLRSLSIKDRKTKEQTQRIAEKILRGQNHAAERNKKWNLFYNRDLKAEHIVEAFALDEKSFEQMIESHNLEKLSTRAFLKVLKVSRTLADLEESLSVQTKHLKKALNWTQQSCAKQRGDSAYGLA